ncbi:MAG: chloride channel protein [Actinobacteria bacterium]|nr:chloride channel protein [Actinomycetota bacterium]
MPPEHERRERARPGRSTARPLWRLRLRSRRSRMAEVAPWEVRRRWKRTVALAACTGVATGVGVHAFSWLVQDVLLRELGEGRLGVQIVAPGLGLLAATLGLRYLARRASPATSEEYVSHFHDRHRSLPLWPLGGRMAAVIATVGGGGALGLEGGPMYLGASIGDAVQRRFARWFSREEAKVLMVAGAAAGVAAIFKAPLAGAVFACEVPYRFDLAARAVLPALVGAVTAYAAFVVFQGTEPILKVFDEPKFAVADLAAAVLLGLLCGLGARWFAVIIAWSNERARRTRVRRRLPAAALALGALAAASHAVFDVPLTLGPGYDVIAWTTDPSQGLGLVALLFVMRVGASAATLVGGGAGGVFVPLAVQGALLGRFVGGVFDGASTSLFPLVGMAAFVGAGYRAPIAAVAFVAEATGRTGFLVPGLVAAVIAELVMGEKSVAPHQQARRTGLLEQRLRLPVTAALARDVHTVQPDTTVRQFVEHDSLRARSRLLPVVNEGRYVGMVRIDDVDGLERDAWDTTTVSDLIHTAYPPAELSWTLRRAMSAMEEHAVPRLAVTDHGRFVGVVTQAEILRLDELLEDGQP